jgi:hypothetical protein
MERILNDDFLWSADKKLLETEIETLFVRPESLVLYTQVDFDL